MPAAYFLLFLVLGKSENEYSRIGRDKSQSAYFFRRLQEPEYETEEGQGLATPPRRGLGLAAPGHGVVAPGTPSVSLFAYKEPSDLKTPGGLTFF